MTRSRTRLSQEATDVFEEAAAFETAVNVFDGDPRARERLSGRLFQSGSLAPSGFLDGHVNGEALQREGEKTEILKSVTAVGERRGSRVCNGLLMDRAGRGLAQKRDRELPIHSHHMLHRVALFLAARLACLLIRIFGGLDASWFCRRLAERENQNPPVE